MRFGRNFAPISPRVSPLNGPKTNIYDMLVANGSPFNYLDILEINGSDVGSRNLQ